MHACMHIDGRCWHDAGSRYTLVSAVIHTCTYLIHTHTHTHTHTYIHTYIHTYRWEVSV
jgi:hypothetical protein